ncbi:MAG: SinI family restriction endonuclease [Drouetiella hepatica Uher 2000/2452]|jgi:hypothetical protein|uniref:SinI family restriction endonuclease n=1 Tax=Drouetiella hepatica Uher 2000/2452 TaxID=904376 RepID=A0A951UM27_9CYAN|nr:SinI family restriction endonuclease [Drouetiella hepatica Uher 2000/2452]
MINFDNIIAVSSSTSDFLQIFKDSFSEINELFSEAHEVILSACYRNPGLSPSMKSTSQIALAQRWLKKYKNSFERRVSQRVSNPPGTVADSIVETIIKARLTGLTITHLEQIKYAHRLSMSAENIQGLLLEEFLAEQLADFGWFCCWGEVLRHVDFCHKDGSLLQIKNRSNSENSSSSRVRINQPIEKWYRVDAQTGNFQWSYFNQKHNTDQFSEESFVEFVRKTLKRNPRALPVEVGNPWQSSSKSSRQS